MKKERMNMTSKQNTKINNAVSKLSEIVSERIKQYVYVDMPELQEKYIKDVEELCTRYGAKRVLIPLYMAVTNSGIIIPPIEKLERIIQSSKVITDSNGEEVYLFDMQCVCWVEAYISKVNN